MPVNKDKGEYNGSCNRTICQKPGAVYYNFSTRLFYCKECADEINRVNRFDAMRQLGHDLCVLHEPKQSYTAGKMIEGHHEILLVWAGRNMRTTGRVVNNGEVTVVYLDEEPK